MSPISPQGVGISDQEAIIWFFKPLTDQYDYQFLYMVNGKQKHKAYWTTYGPVWADFISEVGEKTLRIYVYLLCYKNQSIFSGTPGQATPTLLGKCKTIILLIMSITK